MAALNLSCTVKRTVSYQFEVYGTTYKPAANRIKEEANEVWMKLEAHELKFANIVKGASSRDATLSNHDGWKELLRIRNDRHLATFSESAHGASQDSMADVFGKRKDGSSAEPSIDNTCTTSWPPAAKQRCKDIGIVVVLDGAEVLMMRPRTASEGLSIQCQASALKVVVDFLRARVHDGCFVRKAYDNTGKYAKKRGADALDDSVAAEDDEDAAVEDGKAGDDTDE